MAHPAIFGSGEIPFSHLTIVFRFTPKRLASSTCVRSRRSRLARNCRRVNTGDATQGSTPRQRPAALASPVAVSVGMPTCGFSACGFRKCW